MTLPLLTPGLIVPGLAARPLPERVYLHYGRISRRGEEAKAASLPKQLKLCQDRLQEIEKEPSLAQFYRVWQEDYSGREFERRPQFQEMLAWCKQHPQSRLKPGWIFVWEDSRIGRPLIPGTDQPDMALMAYWKAQFDMAGWRFWALDAEPRGELLTDYLISGLRSHQSGAESAKTARRTREVREDRHRAGYWSSARASWPMARYDSLSGELLREKEYGPAILENQNGALHKRYPVVKQSVYARPGSGVVLGPKSAEDIALWCEIARHIVGDNWGWDHILEWFNLKAPTARPGTAWCPKQVQRCMTRPELIGKVRRRVNGVVQIVDARWPAMVPMELFEQVLRFFEQRAMNNKAWAKREKRHKFLLAGLLVCTHCSLRYRSAYGGKGTPRYFHTLNSRQQVRPQDREVAREHGCRQFAIDARRAEAAIVELIVGERGSPSWFETWRRLRGEVGVFENELEDRLKIAKNRLTKARDAQENAEYYALHCRPTDRDKWLRKNQEADAEQVAAQAAVEAVEREIQNARTKYGQVDLLMNEAVLIREIYAAGDRTRTQAIIRRWVDHIEVAIQRVPTRRRSKHGTVAQKTLLVWLNTSPENPRPVPLPPYCRASNHGVDVLGEVDSDSKLSLIASSQNGE